jgi:hypothetical protein
MNKLWIIGSIVALVTTIIKALDSAYGGAPPATWITFVASNAPFFYGCAAGIAVAGLTRSRWFMLAAVVGVFLFLRVVGF